MPTSNGVPTTARFKAIYVAITVAFAIAAFGLAFAGLWVVGLACLGMGGMMAAASSQMRTPAQERRAARGGDAGRGRA